MSRIWLAAWLMVWGVGAGQTVLKPLPTAGRSGAVPAAAATVLRGMAARAGVIFAGHVVEVDRNDATGYVDVVFGVDAAVRGCAGATRYVLREWAGLWAEEPRRYGVGQRFLMVLTARGASGLSAPVGGMAGRIPLIGVRQGPLASGTGVAPADTGAEDGVEDGVDLRWVQAAAMRTASEGAKAQAEIAKGAGTGWAGPVAAMAEVPVGVAVPGLSAVLAVLNGQ